MRQCDIITIFPDVIDVYMRSSIMGRAQKNNVVTIRAHDLRAYTDDKHHTVDDTPYGGSAGMILKVEPIHKAVEAVRLEQEKKVRVVLLSAKGERYTQRDVERLAQYEQLILICGRYEGVDERVAQHIADEEISIGDYVLTGGELGAMVIVDSVVRLLPGVLGNSESAVHESYSIDGYKEHPHYTKPAVYNGWRVPDILLSGNHSAIERWRKKHARNSKKKEKE